MSARPLIGITTSEVRRSAATVPTPEADPPQPELALGMAYMRAIELGGGIPVVLSPLADAAAIDTLLGRLSGICLSGGPDIDPVAYGGERHLDLGPTEPDLDAFEIAVARRADALGLPLLGLCRGAQTLNVARGGTLRQHLPDDTDGSVAHRQTVSGRLKTHGVRVASGSRLAEVLGGEAVDVNSFHHQAVSDLGEGLTAVAWSSDGVIEGIEADAAGAARGGLLLGVQWHAETLVEYPEHLALFEALVAAGARYGTGAEVPV